MVYAIASDTGWDEHFIRWEISMPRFLQYFHCALRRQGAWTIPAAEAEAGRAAYAMRQLREFFSDNEEEGAG